MTGSEPQDNRTVRMILIFPRAPYEAYTQEQGERYPLLPSGVRMGDPNFSADGQHAAMSHEFSLDDLLAVRDWFGSVTITNGLPADWYPQENLS